MKGATILAVAATMMAGGAVGSLVARPQPAPQRGSESRAAIASADPSSAAAGEVDSPSSEPPEIVPVAAPSRTGAGEAPTRDGPDASVHDRLSADQYAHYEQAQAVVDRVLAARSYTRQDETVLHRQLHGLPPDVYTEVLLRLVRAANNGKLRLEPRMDIF